jgi:ABC-2 type transport system permease protein
MNGPKAMWRLITGYFSANVQSALEYRTSLVSQAAGMLLTDVMWVTFWAAYFDRFHLPGWGQREVVTLWAVVCASYGLANTLCGNAVKLAGMISRGEMDFYLALPKPVLPHALVSRMHLVAPGDFVFGFAAFGLFVRPSPLDWALFGLCTVTGAVILVSFCVLAGSLSFWLGSAEGLFGQLYGAITNFATYPTSIFQGAAKVLIFTVVPAGFIAGVPVELLRAPTAGGLLELIGVAVCFAAVAWGVFGLGLRRYASGNLMVFRD